MNKNIIKDLDYESIKAALNKKKIWKFYIGL